MFYASFNNASQCIKFVLFSAPLPPSRRPLPEPDVLSTSEEDLLPPKPRRPHRRPPPPVPEGSLPPTPEPLRKPAKPQPKKLRMQQLTEMPSKIFYSGINMSPLYSLKY